MMRRLTDRTHKVLVVEDDAGIRGLLSALLDASGYAVVEAGTAHRALLDAKQHRPDLVLVDLGLPDGDGQAVIRAIREFSTVPIIVLSARSMEPDKIEALDGGADDYVTKPFSSTELLARARAALRRNARAADTPPLLRFGAVTVDLASRSAAGPAGTLHLTPLEYRVLECLVRSAGMIVTQEQLIREVWGPDRVGDTRGLRSYIKMLRQKLEPEPGRPRYLLTETGIGYRLALAEE